MIILIAIAFISATVLQAIRLRKNREYYALIISGVFWVIGLALNMMLFLGLNIPNPTKIYMALIDYFR